MNRLLLFIVFFPLLFSAQDRTIDSLKLALKDAKHDTTRCHILSILAETANEEEWPAFNEQLLNLSEKNSKTSTSLKPLYLKYYASALNNVGLLTQYQGDVDKALEYYKKSLKIQEDIKDKKGLATSLNNIGLIYSNQGDISKALDYYHRGLKMQEEIKDKIGIAISLNNIGYIYSNQGDIQKALEYHHRTLNIYEGINSKSGIAITLSFIGVIYDNKRDFSKSLEYYNRSLNIYKEINDKKGISNALNNIGRIYYTLGYLPKAFDYYNRSLKLEEKINDKEGMTFSLTNIGDILLKQGKVKEAIICTQQSLQIAREIGYPVNIKNAAETLKNSYKKQINYKAALEMYELEILMTDSINNAETKRASVKKQFQYQYEMKAAADSIKHTEEQKVKNALLTAQQAQLKQERTQRFALYGGLVLVIAFLGFVFNRFKVTHKQKIIIEQQKVLVDNAFTHLEEKNKEVLDSIRYAKRIQTALLTSEKYIDRKLNELNS